MVGVSENVVITPIPQMEWGSLWYLTNCWWHYGDMWWYLYIYKDMYVYIYIYVCMWASRVDRLFGWLIYGESMVKMMTVGQ